MNVFRKFLFFYTRGGILCPIRHGLNKLFRILFHDRRNRMEYMGRRFYNYYKNLSPENYEKELIRQMELFFFNSGFNSIQEPKTINEKTQWLKIHELTPLKTQLSDKLAVRHWIKEKIGEQYLVPLVGGPWCKGEEIDYSLLPDEFVIKSNHACGQVIVVRNKSCVNKKYITKTVNNWIKIMYGCLGVEWQYFNISPMLYAEKYIGPPDGNTMDYKIYCHNGEPVFLQVIGNRNISNHDGRMACYDLDWNLLDFYSGDYPQYEHLIDKPPCLDEMIDIAKRLSEGFIYVRVDLYVVEGRPKFGEMTFTPGNGLSPWKPQEADVAIGRTLQLPAE